ncbi:hypothetical protein H6G80_03365 [Nostoc sp. FACHB-87]|uniref:hypothetical protein n=1 Tax=Nostocaceae TaxID=1162 RepID=UPI0016894347|nr:MULTISPECIES: hypothetical protein [Nostocaceae]MBD2298174.1 hypothetical protein [Nostoc sp. FACHB-190]MBD2453113.1 hypothetical protein [Nostoc sp. FACHB-87]
MAAPIVSFISQDRFNTTPCIFYNQVDKKSNFYDFLSNANPKSNRSYGCLNMATLSLIPLADCGEEYP